MTITNAIKIGKGIGRILELDNNNSFGLICRQFLRFKVEINTSLPLAPRFNIPCPGMKPRWVEFKYERLDDYYILCGLIGHKKNVCPTPQILIPPEKYDISLCTSTYINP
jgi:hypothetical protein